MTAWEHKIANEIKGEKSVAELAEQFHVPLSQIIDRKQHLLIREADVFGGSQSPGADASGWRSCTCRHPHAANESPASCPPTLKMDSHCEVAIIARQEVEIDRDASGLNPNAQGKI